MLPWKDLPRTCDVTDDPPPIERQWVGEDEHEVVVVPTRIDEQLEAGMAWAAIGGEQADVSPFEWVPPHLEGEPLTMGGTFLMVEHRAADELYVQLAPFAYLTGRVVMVTLRPQPDGTVTAALAGHDYTDYGPPFRFPWEHLEGEVRLSRASWSPGDELALHLEVGQPGARVCARVRVPIPPLGETHSVEW